MDEEQQGSQVSNQLPAWVRDALVEASQHPVLRMRMVTIDSLTECARKQYPHLFQAHA